MELALLFLALAPDVPRLGADEWREREAETRRCDNPISAALLPRAHCDPEIDRRIQWLRVKNLKWFDPRFVERQLRAADYREWLRTCVVERDPLTCSLGDVFLQLRASEDAAHTFMELTAPAGKTWHRHRHLPIWLTGAIFPNEYDQFLDHLEKCRGRLAPMPREK